METTNAQHINSDRGGAFDSIINNKIVALELCDFLLGDFLGQGISRYVFESKLNKKQVIKIDCSPHNDNVLEWNVWNHVMYVPKLAKHFAPCHSISRCGRILVQSKCITGVPYDEYPKMVPEFMADLKYTNWGRIGKNIVCFDYASVIITSMGSNKTKKVNWV